jgi:rod shape determining protein RodA
MLIYQTFENVGMCLGIMPIIGLTLPFFSYGGSSVLTVFAAIGLVSSAWMRAKPAWLSK